MAGQDRCPSSHRSSPRRRWDTELGLQPADEGHFLFCIQKNVPMFGFATDDAHSFQKWGPRESNPGRGWIVVRAAEPTPEALIKGLIEGDFYASTGVELEDVSTTVLSVYAHNAESTAVLDYDVYVDDNEWSIAVFPMGSASPFGQLMAAQPMVEEEQEEVEDGGLQPRPVRQIMEEGDDEIIEEGLVELACG